MKKVALGSMVACIFLYLFYFFLNNPLQVDGGTKMQSLKQVTISNIAGDSILFSEANYPHKLIVNFYGTECGLCLTEINDIVSYSRKTRTKVLFVTADSAYSIQNFIKELEKQKITDPQIMFARISTKTAVRLFGDLTVPQTLLLDDNFRVVGSKKGTISYSFLKKSFE